ncbi:hypothetical protein CBS101457_002247 [Exobasidium rhododendri]|nr:hypothetical protein CBS101457_002247 [Exobasidium rhododendri]
MSAAAPTSAPALLEKRATVSCQKTYAGGLAATNVLQNYGGSLPESTNIYLASMGTLAADVTGVQQPLRVQFDTCTTDGWNVDGQQYGQVKLENDSYNCFTTSNSTSQSATINIQPCGDSNGGILANQWFHGQWDTRGGFRVVPTGNPNDNPNVRPDAVFVYGGAQIPEPNPVIFQAQDDPGLTELQFLGIEYF